MKKLISFLLFFFVAIGSQATTFQYGKLYYSILSDGKTVEVSLSQDGTAYSGGINVLASVKYNNTSYEVTSIGDKAFAGSSITKIVVPSSIKSISKNAFSNCTSLATVELKSSYIGDPSQPYTKQNNLTSLFGKQVTTYVFYCNIGAYALYGAYQLKSVNIKENVKSIGTYAFLNCTKLKTVTIFSDSISANTSYRTQYNLSHVFGSQVTTYQFRTNIGDYALYGASNVTDVWVNGATTIGKYALYGTSVKKFTVPSGVREIGEAALAPVETLEMNSKEYCTSDSLRTTNFTEAVSENLKKIVFGVNEISSNAFFYGKLIKSTGSLNFSSVKYFGKVGYSYYIRIFENYDTITFGSDLKRFLQTRFHTVGDAPLINTVVFSGELPDRSAFYPKYFFGTNCFKHVENIVIKDATTIPGFYFQYNPSYCQTEPDKIKTITLSENLTTVGNSAFSGLHTLESINLPEGLKKIGNWAFYNCKSLSEVNLPSTLDSMGIFCFQNCEKLTMISIPEGITEIRDAAFDNCKSLMTIQIPSTAETIHEQAFTQVGENLQLVKDLSDKFPINTDIDKNCVIIVKTEKRAEEWRAKGYKVVSSVERMTHTIEDINMDGKPNGLDVLKVYEAIQKQ